MILQLFRIRLRPPLLVSPLVRTRSYLVVKCLHPVIVVKGEATLPGLRVTRGQRRRMQDLL